MKKRYLNNIKVSNIGLGCMGYSHGYGPTPEDKKSIELIQKAYEYGCTFFDTAEVYGNGHNEKIVGKAIHEFREDIILASKYLDIFIPNNKKEAEEHIRRNLNNSLKRLQTDYIDIYYEHRRSNIPVEWTAEIMQKFIDEGLINGWGMSQVDSKTIKKAHNITPITAIQSEYSIMERMFEKDVIPLCEKLNIGFVPFSPLASGFLSGKYKKQSEYVGDDVRRVITRYKESNQAKNQPILDVVQEFADRKNCTMAQVSLAWLLARSDNIVPIPGSKKLDKMIENLDAGEVTLTKEEYKEFNEKLEPLKIHGNRTSKDIAKLRYMD
ncbi:MAG: aldo/keto reductase [Methanosphaera stadtmanae]|nr:aldo/keto reductase [Methanosphaera stadtmanae]